MRIDKHTKKYNINTKSNTDTEVLIELFSKLGVDCFNLLNGIFAFIIFILRKSLPL